ncbi:hypothetical protein MLD52_23095, partial [Puniceicoccaceae bacterium K14]|nr:hypothetical protein [Puniceicoccaceae bacterium K14]
IVTAGILSALASTASAGLLTTTFSSNNGYAGNMFDVTTFGNDLNITGLGVNTDANIGSNVTFSLYTKIGSYSGSETNASDWTLIDTKTFASAGEDNESFFDVSDFVLSSNTTYGFYVDLSSYNRNTNRLVYTNGSNTYSNADLQIDTGIGRGTGFSSSIFSPRTWNGSIHYEVASNTSATKVPDTTSTLALFG